MASTYDKASLVLIPSGTKEGTIFSQKPTNGDGDFTFSRSPSATRVNAYGLIEKETQNLLLQSNSFDTTWVTTSSSVTGGQSGYDGSSDAWLLSNSAASGRIYQNITGSGIVTSSIYLKANASNWGLLQLDSTPDAYVYVDLINGVSGSTGSGNIDATITSVGGGWYRISVTANSTTRIRIYPAEANGDVSGTSGSVYIQDAQLEQGLVARDYIETTTSAVYGGITDNIPRLDYTDSSCPALLLEPQRTNLYNSSEYDCFDSGGTRMAATGNETAFCDAYDTPVPAAKVQNTGSLYFYDTTSPSATTAHTWSAFFRLPDTNNLGTSRIRVNTTNTFASSETRFDLVNGTILTTNAEDATITSFPNNW